MLIPGKLYKIHHKIAPLMFPVMKNMNDTVAVHMKTHDNVYLYLGKLSEVVRTKKYASWHLFLWNDQMWSMFHGPEKYIEVG